MLNTYVSLAFAKCIKEDADLFREFLTDYIILSSKRYGYKKESTKPGTNFYGLYLGTWTVSNGVNWLDVRRLFGDLSKINDADLITFKNSLMSDNHQFSDSTYDFLFKYDHILEVFYRTRSYYNDMLQIMVNMELDEKGINELKAMVDLMYLHQDKIDEIIGSLEDFIKKEVKQYNINDDVNGTFELVPKLRGNNNGK